MKLYGNKARKRSPDEVNEAHKLFFIIAAIVFIPCLVLWITMLILA